MPGKACGMTLASICKTSEVSRWIQYFTQFSISCQHPHIKKSLQNKIYSKLLMDGCVSEHFNVVEWHIHPRDRFSSLDIYSTNLCLICLAVLRHLRLVHSCICWCRGHSLSTGELLFWQFAYFLVRLDISLKCPLVNTTSWITFKGSVHPDYKKTYLAR